MTYHCPSTYRGRRCVGACWPQVVLGCRHDTCRDRRRSDSTTSASRYQLTTPTLNSTRYATIYNPSICIDHWPTVTPCCGTVIIECAWVCYLRDVYRFICFIVAMYAHHLGLYCVLFRRVLIYKIDVALQLTKLWLKKLLLQLLHQTWNRVTFCYPVTQWPGNPATRRPSWPGDPVL